MGRRGMRGVRKGSSDGGLSRDLEDAMADRTPQEVMIITQFIRLKIGSDVLVLQHPGIERYSPARNSAITS